MKLYAPQYYKDFRCIADRCRHSCCIGWEIDVDEDTLAYYRALPAPLSDEILGGIVTGEEGAHFALCANGRCPNLDERGLCRIISALGEEALCDICREHPRFYHETDRDEVGLGAACEAAATLILSRDDYADFVCVAEDESLCVPTTAFDARGEREALYITLSQRAEPLALRLLKIVSRYGERAVSETIFAQIEYLDESHRALFVDTAQSLLPLSSLQAPECERFLAYLVYRHASPSLCEEQFARAVRFSLLLTRLFATLWQKGLNPVSAAVAISEEIDYSEENTRTLLLAME